MLPHSFLPRRIYTDCVKWHSVQVSFSCGFKARFGGLKIAHVRNTCERTALTLSVVFRNDQPVCAVGARCGSRTRRESTWVAEDSLRKLSYNDGVEADPQTAGVSPQQPNQFRSAGPAPERGVHRMPCQPKFFESADTLFGMSCGSTSAPVRRELPGVPQRARMEC